MTEWGDQHQVFSYSMMSIQAPTTVCDHFNGHMYTHMYIFYIFETSQRPRKASAICLPRLLLRCTVSLCGPLWVSPLPLLCSLCQVWELLWLGKPGPMFCLLYWWPVSLRSCCVLALAGSQAGHRGP